MRRQSREQREAGEAGGRTAVSAGRQQPVAVAVPPGRDVVAVPALAPLLLLYGNVLLPRLPRPRLPLKRAVVALREEGVS